MKTCSTSARPYCSHFTENNKANREERDLSEVTQQVRSSKDPGLSLPGPALCTIVCIPLRRTLRPHPHTGNFPVDPDSYKHSWLPGEMSPFSVLHLLTSPKTSSYSRSGKSACGLLTLVPARWPILHHVGPTVSDSGVSHLSRSSSPPAARGWDSPSIA